MTPSREHCYCAQYSSVLHPASAHAHHHKTPIPMHLASPPLTGGHADARECDIKPDAPIMAACIA
ncbi:hypothetical protein K505DRAFT_328647 [Melanomma pulvis-pyrius CBS 109.77]|uniref:Uncharacterized protein n=1 Tax=Melanomma pulvis-pyrius CBS 109.77 TaxID=1314802 RepID=A0A6A6WY39_9PLEO|nr:hypothetical protein K505DRAFT_328647 [Melanomma pulvis-pyrius CBS 109.77]